MQPLKVGYSSYKHSYINILLLLLLLLLLLKMYLQSFVDLWPTLMGFLDLHIETFGRTPWLGDQPHARPLPTQDNTTQKPADTHPCPKQDSNLPIFKRS
jgi:hypothetical protein